MRLLLDEHLSPVIAEQLRSRGHDVVAVVEAGLTRAPDQEVLRQAVRERRAIVTFNIRDFRPLHSVSLAAGQVHFGMVLLSRSRFSTSQGGFGKLTAALDGLLRAHSGEEDLACLEHWL